MKSMTGYSFLNFKSAGAHITMEIKSYNNKYFHLSVRLPNDFQILENYITDKIKSRVSRGKIIISIDVKPEKQSLISENKLEQNFKKVKKLAEKYNLTVSLGDLMTVNRIILETQSGYSKKMEDILKTKINKLIDNFIKFRETEGRKTAEEIGRVLKKMKSVLDVVNEEKETEKIYMFEKIKKNIEALLNDVNVDENRILTEAAVLADKIDISEEIMRLKSHINEMETFLSKDNIGKKAEFLSQELLREANTISSKAQSIKIKKAALNIKNEIEKIREQAQNIE